MIQSLCKVGQSTQFAASATMSCVSVDISTAASICHTLCSILQGSFGPNALHNMISTATGQVLISSDGSTILKSLHLSHPVGNLIMDAVQSHHAITGDGTKTFLLILREGLQTMCKTCGIETAHSHVRSQVQKGQMQQLCIEMSQAFSHLLNHTLPEVLLPTILKHAVVTDFDNLPELREYCLNIVRTFLSGKFTPRVVEILTEIVCGVIFKTAGDGNLSTAVLQLIDDYELVWLEVPGKPVSSSHVVDGVILQRDFAVKAESLDALKDSITFAVLENSLEPSKTETPSTLYVRKEEELSRAHLWKQQAVQTVVKELESKGVNVLLTSEHASDMVLYLCKAANISVVHHIPKEELQRLCRLSTLQPLVVSSSVANSINVGKAKFCKQISCGQNRYVHIGLHEQSGMKAAQGIVCGPNAGLCKLFTNAMHNALKVVRMWLDVTNSTDDSSLKGSGYNRYDWTSHNVKPSLLLGGGTFEILVHKYLHEHADNTRDSKLSVTCKVMSEAVLSVPRTLHVNSQIQKCSINSFPRLLAKATMKGCSGIDGYTGQLMDSNTVKVYEPVRAKYFLLCHVVQVLQQILRIDSLVSVRHLPESNQSDSDSD
ncbi:BBSome complex assembly protein BBS10-like isoform X2 [Branchiostoma floridae x Branchiostoma belcheri]